MRATFRLAAAVPASFPCLYVSVRSSYKHRFKVTATGKILFPSPGYVHKRFNKSHRQLGDLSKKQVMKPRYAKTVSVCSLRLAAWRQQRAAMHVVQGHEHTIRSRAPRLHALRRSRSWALRFVTFSGATTLPSSLCLFLYVKGGHDVRSQHEHAHGAAPIILQGTAAPTMPNTPRK